MTGSARAEAALPQQPRGPGDRTVGAMAIGGHHVRRQRIQEQRHVAGIVGQRGDGVGILGERDQRHLPAAVPATASRVWRACREPRGREVAGQRGERQVQRHHQWLPPAQRDRLRGAGSGRHRDERQGERRQRGPAAPRPHGLAVARPSSRCGSRCASTACRQPWRWRAAPQAPGQQRQREQAQQPPRAQDMQTATGPRTSRSSTPPCREREQATSSAAERPRIAFDPRAPPRPAAIRLQPIDLGIDAGQRLGVAGAKNRRRWSPRSAGGRPRPPRRPPSAGSPAPRAHHRAAEARWYVSRMPLLSVRSRRPSAVQGAGRVHAVGEQDQHPSPAGLPPLGRKRDGIADRGRAPGQRDHAACQLLAHAVAVEGQRRQRIRAIAEHDQADARSPTRRSRKSASTAFAAVRRSTGSAEFHVLLAHAGRQVDRQHRSRPTCGGATGAPAAAGARRPRIQQAPGDVRATESQRPPPPGRSRDAAYARPTARANKAGSRTSAQPPATAPATAAAGQQGPGARRTHRRRASRAGRVMAATSSWRSAGATTRKASTRWREFATVAVQPAAGARAVAEDRLRQTGVQCRQPGVAIQGFGTGLHAAGHRRSRSDIAATCACGVDAPATAASNMRNILARRRLRRRTCHPHPAANAAHSSATSNHQPAPAAPRWRRTGMRRATAAARLHRARPYWLVEQRQPGPRWDPRRTGPSRNPAATGAAPALHPGGTEFAASAGAHGRIQRQFDPFPSPRGGQERAAAAPVPAGSVSRTACTSWCRAKPDQRALRHLVDAGGSVSSNSRDPGRSNRLAWSRAMPSPASSSGRVAYQPPARPAPAAPSRAGGRRHRRLEPAPAQRGNAVAVAHGGPRNQRTGARRLHRFGSTRVPKYNAGAVSASNRVSRSRSAWNSLVCGLPVRGRRQSMWRASSPRA